MDLYNKVMLVEARRNSKGLRKREPVRVDNPVGCNWIRPKSFCLFCNAQFPTAEERYIHQKYKHMLTQEDHFYINIPMIMDCPESEQALSEGYDKYAFKGKHPRSYTKFLCWRIKPSISWRTKQQESHSWEFPW